MKLTYKRSENQTIRIRKFRENREKLVDFCAEKPVQYLGHDLDFWHDLDLDSYQTPIKFAVDGCNSCPGKSRQRLGSDPSYLGNWVKFKVMSLGRIL